MLINDVYKHWCDTPSNMQNEIRTIHRYACMCKHITEFGFGVGRSGSAILAAKPKKYITYDVRDYGPREQYKKLAEFEELDFEFILGDSTEVEIEPTEMLFIDSWHTFKQKTIELSKHVKKVSKFILIHDTRTCGHRGEDGTEPGYLQAIKNFLLTNENWYLLEIDQTGNGICVLSCMDEYRHEKLGIDRLAIK